MGITPAMLRLLAQQVKADGYPQSVLTFGTQDVWGGESDVRASLESAGVAIQPYEVRPTTSAFFAHLATKNPRYSGYVHARTLFEMIGVKDYVDLDADTHDGAGVRHDLNVELPAVLRNRFDLVLDFGTTEHIFAVPAVLASIANALRENGRVIHALPLPCLYWSQHGYYCFNPDLFIDFYASNGFNEIECRIIYYEKPFMRPVDDSLYHRPAKTFPYRRGTTFDYLLPADAIASFWLVARKKRHAARMTFPNQRHAVGDSAGGENSGRAALLRTLYFATLPFAGSLARRAYARSRGVSLSTI